MCFRINRTVWNKAIVKRKWQVLSGQPIHGAIELSDDLVIE